MSTLPDVPLAPEARVEANLTAAHAEVKAEIARTDTKASLLLAFDGAALAACWTAVTGLHLPTATLMVAGVGVALLVAAAGVLLAVVRPRLGGPAPVGFPKWATLTAEEIRTELRGDHRPQDIAALARIAVAKFARLQRAVDLTRAAGVVFALAAVIAVAVRIGGGA